MSGRARSTLLLSPKSCTILFLNGTKIITEGNVKNAPSSVVVKRVEAKGSRSEEDVLSEQTRRQLAEIEVDCVDSKGIFIGPALAATVRSSAELLSRA